MTELPGNWFDTFCGHVGKVVDIVGTDLFSGESAKSEKKVVLGGEM